MCKEPEETAVEYGEEPDNTPERAEEMAGSFEFADAQPTESHEVGEEDLEGEDTHQEYDEEDEAAECDDCDCEDEEDAPSEDDCCGDEDEDDYFGGDACEYCPDPVPGCEPGVYCPYED